MHLIEETRIADGFAWNSRSFSLEASLRTPGALAVRLEMVQYIKYLESLIFRTTSGIEPLSTVTPLFQCAQRKSFSVHRGRR